MEARELKMCTMLCARHEKLVSNDMTWRELEQELAQYFATRYATITVERGDADLLEEDLYEDIGKEAAEDFAAGCTNYIIPAGEQWARVESEDDEAPQMVRDYWARATKTLLSDMVASSFHLEAQEDFFITSVFGTANMKVEKGKKFPYRFSMVNPGTYVFEVDEDDLPDIHYVLYKRTAKQCADQFGEKELHDSMIKELSDPEDPSVKKHSILYVVMPRKTSIAGMTVGTNRPYAEYWIDVTNKHMLFEDGYYENPFIVSRMYKTSDSARGYSLAMRTLSKVRQLSQMEEDKMIAQELLNDPPWLSPNQGAFELVNQPGGINYYDASLDPRHRPEQMRLHNAVHHTREEIQMKREEVRKTFFADMFQAFADQPKQMTATEVLAIMEQKLVLFTPFFARYTKEKLNRIIERCLNIGIREGRIESPPPEVMANGGGYKIIYSSRVALAIKLLENKNLLQLIDVIIPMRELDPHVAKVIKSRDFIRRLSENLAVDPDLIETEENIVEQIRQENEMAAMQQQLEMAETASKAVSNLPQRVQKQIA